MEEILIKISSNGKNYHLLVVYPDEEPLTLKITLVDGTEVWYGEVSQEDLIKQADAIEKNFLEFWSNTKKALSCEANKGNFCYDVKSEDSHTEFSWKQSLKHGIKFQLGSVKLFRQEQNDISSFLDVAVEQFKNMKSEISCLAASNRKLLSEQEKSLKKLDECITVKNALEKDLFQKFTAVLNAKKAKIRELKQQCKENQIQSKQQNKINDFEKSVESNDEEENTDDEKETERGKSAGRARGHAKMPMILDENCAEDEDGPPAVKRKAANRRKRDTTASVIPRTTSLPRPVKQNSLSKQNTSSQRLPSTPTDLLSDPDKLLDEL